MTAGTGQPQPLGASRRQADRIADALSRDLGAFYRVAWCVADEAEADDAIAWLALVAAREMGHVEPGRERAWLLRSLLRFLGASSGEGDDDEVAAGDLPELPMQDDAAAEDPAFLRLHGALRGIPRDQRASVVLVVEEGLSLAQGASVQGGTDDAFARRFALGMAALDDDVIEALLARRDFTT